MSIPQSIMLSAQFNIPFDWKLKLSFFEDNETLQLALAVLLHRLDSGMKITLILIC